MLCVAKWCDPYQGGQVLGCAWQRGTFQSKARTVQRRVVRGDAEPCEATQTQPRRKETSPLDAKKIDEILNSVKIQDQVDSITEAIIDGLELEQIVADAVVEALEKTARHLREL